MYIDLMEIENYKTFADKQTLHFEKGFNLLLGPNNSGKTSILEALDLNWSLDQPHRSSRSIPSYGGVPPGHSMFRCSIRAELSELINIGSEHLYLPAGSNTGEIDSINNCLEALKSVHPLCLDFNFGANLFSCNVKDDSNLFGGSVQYNMPKAIRAFLINVRGQRTPSISLTHSDINSPIISLFNSFQQLIYKFSAQRRPTSRSASLDIPKLDPNANYLAYCINNLQTNDSYGHSLLCSWVNKIFPSIKWVQSTSLHNEFEIRCLPELPSARRSDLAVPMSSMGTGLGNVLAMLYVVLTSRTPQLIAIDEPNAFLHPKALRELLGILEVEGRQHQFLLTAHSADVLTAVSAKTISILDFDGVATTVKSVNSHDIHQIRASLADLGIRVTDLHAKDQVLWVEGQTEELVMPELLRWACPEAAAGTAVLRVERTGTFSKKSVVPSEVASLYERLSTSSALVPPMVTILLDGELVPQNKKKATEKSSGGKLRYLPRRMLENYLLDSEAISTALKENGENFDHRIVFDHLRKAGLNDQSDIKNVDAALILKQVFSNISEARLEFRKTRDVQTMVSFLIEKKPEFLFPLRDFLRSLFGLQ